MHEAGFAIVTEAKLHRLFYVTPKEDQSLYVGAGIGLSTLRIVPVYATIGLLNTENKDSAFKTEVQISTVPHQNLDVVFLLSSLKISSGVLF